MSYVRAKKVALLTVHKSQVHEGKTLFFTKVVRVIERTINKHVQMLLVSDIALERWWINLDRPAQKIIYQFV